MKEFKPTSWAIDNRTSVYIITIILLLAGLFAYNRLQKENFPDIVIPTIFVGTAYPGTSPSDMENLVTRPIEKQIKSLSGVKTVTSNSLQDYAVVTVQFNTDIAVEEAKQRVKDAVDKARMDLPNDLPDEPNVQEINFSEFPIMFINLSGNYSLDRLKKFAEDIEDRVEGLPEITRVDIVGALDKEVKIDVDLYKMQAAKVTFADIERAIASENATISGGSIRVGEMRRAVRVVGQYQNPNELGEIVLKSLPGHSIYLKDIATVTDGFKERESYARLDNQPVITINVIKRSGKNLIEASDKIGQILQEMQATSFPKDLKVTITGDQSDRTRNTLNDLINSIIIGFILVTIILMFFMGTTNALFVGLSVPLSMCLAFIFMPTIGFTLNMIVLFSFLLALGIVVDDAIVVVENTHRVYNTTRMNIKKAAKFAAGEVFVPVLAGTLTTLAPFLPLSFWPGIVGEFMFFLPITLIIVLISSLLIAFFINPVFAVTFMRRDNEIDNSPRARKIFYIILGVLFLVALAGYASGSVGFGNLVIFLILIIVLNKYLFTRWINSFQRRVLPAFMARYESLLRFILSGKMPYYVLGSIIFLLFFSIGLTMVRSPHVVFFPDGDPDFVYTYIKMPIGTDQSVTDSVTRLVEKRIKGVIGEHNSDVESVISNVGIGAGEPNDANRSAQSNRGKVAIAFVEFQHRARPSREYLPLVREAVKGIPGTEISVDREATGPPVGKPISIEIAGENFAELIRLSKDLEKFIDARNIAGIEDLRSDLEENNPEIQVNIDRVRANREGLSTAQIGMELRTAIFGKEASNFKRDEEEYPIEIRYNELARNNIDALLDMHITFREATGAIKQVPLSAVADISYSSTYGGINRKNMKRVIILSSNVLSGYNANAIVGQISEALKSYQVPQGFEVKMGGEQEDQKETQDFLTLALFASFGLIFLILVTQFNSLSKTLIILSEILFSIIGVLLGFSIFKMDISIVMTGVGIVALAGIVVKNGILIVAFTDQLLKEGLSVEEAIVQAGKERLNPVILTAIATTLGLVPLAIGLNINFFTLFTEFKPNFFVGGESMAFWGPLAWSIIFGLTFATFVTLLVVPVMYLLNEKIKSKILRRSPMQPSGAISNPSYEEQLA